MTYWHDAATELYQPLAETPRLGLITDVDGTISPIVDEPDQARVTPRNRQLLQALQPCCALVAVISGRAADDVHRRVGLPGLVYVGNHGLERWIDGEIVPDPQVARFRPQLEAALQVLRGSDIPGLFIEDKGLTLSVHYRQTADPDSVALQLRPQMEMLATMQDLRLYQGRMVFELRPPVETNKGTAFRHLVKDFHLDAAVYLGDDTTDVDALIAARELRQRGKCYALGIGVQSPDMPITIGEAADVLVSGVSGVESFFAWLLDARKASSTC